MAEAARRHFTINFGPQHPAAHGVLDSYWSSTAKWSSASIAEGAPSIAVGHPRLGPTKPGNDKVSISVNLFGFVVCSAISAWIAGCKSGYSKSGYIRMAAGARSFCLCDIHP
jgi:hypothetical protein